MRPVRRAPAAQRKHHDPGQFLLLRGAPAGAPGGAPVVMASPVGVEQPAPWGGDAAASRGEFPEPFWRSLFYFNVYRLLVALLLFMSVAVWGTNLWFGSRDLALFVTATIGYVVFGVACFALISTRRRFNLQLTLQVAADVGFIVILLFASGGISA